MSHEGGYLVAKSVNESSSTTPDEVKRVSTAIYVLVCGSISFVRG